MRQNTPVNSRVHDKLFILYLIAPLMVNSLSHDSFFIKYKQITP